MSDLAYLEQLAMIGGKQGKTTNKEVSLTTQKPLRNDLFILKNYGTSGAIKQVVLNENQLMTVYK